MVSDADTELRNKDSEATKTHKAVADDLASRGISTEDNTHQVCVMYHECVQYLPPLYPHHENNNKQLSEIAAGCSKPYAIVLHESTFRRRKPTRAHRQRWRPAVDCEDLHDTLNDFDHDWNWVNAQNLTSFRANSPRHQWEYLPPDGTKHDVYKGDVGGQLAAPTMFPKWFPTAILAILIMTQGAISAGCGGTNDPPCMSTASLSGYSLSQYFLVFRPNPRNLLPFSRYSATWQHWQMSPGFAFNSIFNVDEFKCIQDVCQCRLLAAC
ncbi:hypothetical protein C8J57DRAFT_1471328, partial [Mycena rebaudengoi]